MPRIFISYRREDTIGYAGRIYDRLASHFGTENVFMDVENLSPGIDFKSALEQSLASCDHFLAIIGRQWISISDAFGRPRITDPDDMVVLEIAAALDRPAIHVIPLLVNGARMPQARELPSRLLGIARRQALDLPDSFFAPALVQLIELIEQPKPQSVESPAPVFEPPKLREATSRWSLPEELYLLCIEPNSGEVDYGRELDHGIAAAILAELVSLRRVSLEPNETFAIRDRACTGDSILDRGLDYLTTLSTTKRPQLDRLWSMSEAVNNQTIRDSLVNKGVLERKTVSNLIFFERTIYPPASATLRSEIVYRVSSAAEGYAPMPSRTATLLNIFCSMIDYFSRLPVPAALVCKVADEARKQSELDRVIELLMRRKYSEDHRRTGYG